MTLRIVAATAAISFACGLATVTPASAQVEFAVFNPVPSSNGGVVNFTEDAAGNLMSATSSTPTVFNFDVTPLANFGNLAATFSFDAATTTPATSSGGIVSAAYDGSFDFYYAGPTVTQGGVTLTKGELLLGGTFANAAFSGRAGSSGGGLADDSLTGAVTYTSGLSSSVLPLASTGESFSLAFIDISPVLATQNGFVRHFTAVGDGKFASNLTTSGGGGGVPEPATWAMMIFGLAGIGATVRRLRPAVLA